MRRRSAVSPPSPHYSSTCQKLPLGANVNLLFALLMPSPNLQFGHLDHIISFQSVTFLTSAIIPSKLNSHLGDIFNILSHSFIFNFSTFLVPLH